MQKFTQVELSQYKKSNVKKCCWIDSSLVTKDIVKDDNGILWKIDKVWSTVEHNPETYYRKSKKILGSLQEKLSN